MKNSIDDSSRRHYGVNHCYDSVPHSQHVVDVVSAHISDLMGVCIRFYRPTELYCFSDVAADALIKCANKMELDDADDDTILNAYTATFRSVITHYRLESFSSVRHLRLDDF